MRKETNKVRCEIAGSSKEAFIKHVESKLFKGSTVAKAIPEILSSAGHILSWYEADTSDMDTNRKHIFWILTETRLVQIETDMLNKVMSTVKPTVVSVSYCRDEIVRVDKAFELKLDHKKGNTAELKNVCIRFKSENPVKLQRPEAQDEHDIENFVKLTNLLG
mgnify:FL=1